MKQFFFISVIFLIFSSCVKNNPDPSWIEVTEWTLMSNPNSLNDPGALTHNFSDAYVLVNDKVIGIFEVPFKIPVLTSGNVNIKVYPVIRNNGISATKKIYPFAEGYEVNLELIQNQTVTINPTTQYFSNLQFWLEDFEDAAVKIENDPNSMTVIMTGNDPAILSWGNFYGLVNLNTVDSTWVAYTDDMYLPRNKEVYLEIDYYNTNALTTGVIGISSSSIVNNANIQLNKQDPSTVKWKKIYIDLKEIISGSTEAEYFKQSFQAVIDSGESDGQIILDNIKVVYF